MRHFSKFIVILMLALGGCLGNPGTERAVAFDVSIHKEITAVLAEFLRPLLYEDIVDEQRDQDWGETATNESIHFTDCRFVRVSRERMGIRFEEMSSTDYVRYKYGQIIDELNPSLPDSFSAADRFGSLLHPVQDFYSHSNWVELNPGSLIDRGLGSWSDLRPYVALPGTRVMPLAGPLPSGWTITLTSDAISNEERIPLVRDSQGREFLGLVTSVTGDIGEPCPRETHRLRHLDAFCLMVRRGHPDWICIHKDNASRPYHEIAKRYAKDQTRHEWCRLLYLLRERYDYQGASVPIALWVDPKASRPPHPAGTPCALTYASEGPRVSVAIESIKVKDDRDPLGPGEINFSFVVYDGRFQRSVRTQVGPLTIGTGDSVSQSKFHGPLSMRVPRSDTLIVTLWGWDDDGVWPGQFSSGDNVLSGVTAVFSGEELKNPGVRRRTVASSHLEVTFRVISRAD